jgi:hypothetical protein
MVMDRRSLLTLLSLLPVASFGRNMTVKKMKNSEFVLTVPIDINCSFEEFFKTSPNHGRVRSFDSLFTAGLTSKEILKLERSITYNKIVYNFYFSDQIALEKYNEKITSIGLKPKLQVQDNV